jgi:hypothetical protein
MIYFFENESSVKSSFFLSAKKKVLFLPPVSLVQFFEFKKIKTIDKRPNYPSLL